MTFPVRRLAEAATKIQDGTHFSPRLGGGPHKYITSKNIGFGGLRLESVQTISREEHEKIYRRADTRFGDLLLTKDGANTGNAAINSFREEISLLSSVAFIRANPKTATESFLLQYILSGEGQKQISDAMAGNAITRLTLAKIRGLVVPIPDVDEQLRIGETLGDVDSLITSLERLIAKKRAIKQGMMQELLTGRTRLPAFSVSWAEAHLGSVAKVLGGGTPSTQVRKYWGGSIPWFTPTEIAAGGAGLVTQSERTITTDGLASSSGHLLPAGTVLVTSRASIGNCGVAGVPVATNQGFTSLVPQDLKSTWFLYYWVQQNKAELESRSAGSTFLEISARKVAAIPMLAPSLDEQDAIGAALRDADVELAALERRLETTRAIKQGMMQELLTGRTRLMPTEASV